LDLLRIEGMRNEKNRDRTRKPEGPREIPRLRFETNTCTGTGEGLSVSKRWVNCPNRTLLMGVKEGEEVFGQTFSAGHEEPLGRRNNPHERLAFVQ